MLNESPNERPNCKEVLNEKHFWALSEAEEKQIDNFNEHNIYLRVPQECYGTETSKKFHTIMRTKFLTSEVESGLPPVRYSTGQSGFGVCCPGGRRDLKPDYRMSGFGSND
jgi:hypothetical protein